MNTLTQTPERHHLDTKTSEIPYTWRQRESRSVFPLEYFGTVVARWLSQREQLMFNNQNIGRISEHTVGELREAWEAAELGNVEEQHLELMDAVFLPQGLAFARAVNLDLEWIRAHANGQGRSFAQGVDRAIELAGNVQESTLQRDLEETLAVTLSVLQHLDKPLPESPTGSEEMRELQIYLRWIRKIERKNNTNYLAKFFQRFNPFYQRWLTNDEFAEATPHARHCLRLIRDYLGQVAGLDVIHGIKESDCDGLEDYIFGFVDSRHHLECIFAELQRRYPIPKDLQVKLGEDNRLVVRQRQTQPSTAPVGY